MKIFVIGTRGIPSLLGGVETHCENLYPHIASKEIEVTIICRSCYVSDKKEHSVYKGVKLKSLYAKKSKNFEAIMHTSYAVLYAAIKRPDILHIHAIGPNLLTPFARLLGLKVVMTHHGPDYKREKWGLAAKMFLSLGEFVGVKFANKVIVISSEIGRRIEEKYGRKDYILIPNGVPQYIIDNRSETLKSVGVSPQGYIFTLGRFVPEKGFMYLIEAWKKSKKASQYQLVIAGSADHETSFSRKIIAEASSQGVILTGFIKGEPLKQLYSNARLFVLPSFYEGLPISLLEAMSYGLDILASDIPANKEVNLPDAFYFGTGDVDDLVEHLDKKLENEIVFTSYNMEKYNWEKISEQTKKVYKDIMNLNSQ